MVCNRPSQKAEKLIVQNESTHKISFFGSLLWKLVEVKDLLSIVPVHCVTVQRFCVNMSFVKNNEENNFTKVFGRHFCDIILLIFFFLFGLSFVCQMVVFVLCKSSRSIIPWFTFMQSIELIE